MKETTITIIIIPLIPLVATVQLPATLADTDDEGTVYVSVYESIVGKENLGKLGFILADFHVHLGS